MMEINDNSYTCFNGNSGQPREGTRKPGDIFFNQRKYGLRPRTLWAILTHFHSRRLPVYPYTRSIITFALLKSCRGRLALFLRKKI